jgi:tetratricopeptide (TPR) repeat protein
MMGINDPQDFAKRSWREKLSQHSKAFKLFDMIVSHWSAKQQEAKGDFVQMQIAKLERQALLQPSSRILVELTKANLYRSANRPEDEKKTILKVLALDPQNSQAWHLLGIYYQRHAEHQKAIDALQNAYRFGSPEIKVSSLEHIAQAYKFLNQYDQAEKIYRDILNQQPHHPQVNGALADIFLEQNEYQQAIKFYVQQLAIDPRSVDVYGKLAHSYRRTEQVDKARAIFEAGAKVNTDNLEFFYEWGFALLEDKKYSQAQNAFEQALKLNKSDVRGVNDRINERLLECYQAQNQTSQATELKNQMQKQAGRYNPATQKNYRALAQILAKRGIGLVAVQYPHRPLAGLEDILSSQTGIIFVDNQEIFQKEIEKVGYDQVFTDRFAGDFGHCTPKGNRLLAQHVAEAILNLCKP